MRKKAIHEKILKELNISEERYEHIVSYVMQMIYDYNGDVIDIIKEIPLNLKGNERYFTMFVIGNSSSPSFHTTNDKEKEKFIIDTAESLKISKERAILTSDYVANVILEDMEEKHISVVDSMKKIINSNFSDLEKDYMLFIYGLVLTADYEEL